MATNPQLRDQPILPRHMQPPSTTQNLPAQMRSDLFRRGEYPNTTHAENLSDMVVVGQG